MELGRKPIESDAAMLHALLTRVPLISVQNGVRIIGDGINYGLWLGTDTQLYRSGANAISTGGDSFSATKLTASTNGSGAGVAIGSDTLLYRSTTNTIRTPDFFQVDAGLGVGTAESTVGNIKATGEIYNVAWTDISQSVTIGGWSSFTDQYIYYKKIGKTVFMKFYLLGTSNSDVAQFMLPSGQNMTTNFHNLDIVVRRCDNGSWGWGFGEIPVATPYIIQFYVTASGGGWTSSGQKAVMGEFFYQTA